MTTGHDYAGCERDPCDRCHDYGLGWAAGKDKAHEELRGGSWRMHVGCCGCELCRTRARMKDRMDAMRPARRT